MVRLLLTCAALAACYDPQLADCVDKCDTSGICPDGLSCDGKFCRAPGAGAASCTDTTQDAMTLVDATAACPPTPVQQGCTPLGPMPSAPYCIVTCSANTGTYGNAFTAGSWKEAVLDDPMKVAAAMASANGAVVWIGLTQAMNSSTPQAGWTWVNGQPLATALWANMQPNDIDGTENNAENCASMTGATWADEPCTISHAFQIAPF